MSEPEIDPVVTPDPAITPDPLTQPPEMVPRAELDAMRQEATKYHRQRQDWEKKFEALDKRALSEDDMQKFQALLDREAAAAKEAEEAEDKLLAERGEFEEVLKKQRVTSATAIQQLKDNATKDLAERDEKLATMNRQLMNSAAEAPLLAAMAELGMKQAASAIRLIQDGHTRWDDDGQSDWLVGCEEESLSDGSKKMVAVVVERSTGATVMKDGHPLSVKDFVNKFAASQEGRMRLPAIEDTGTGTHIGIALSGDVSYEALLKNNELRWKMQADEPERFAKLHLDWMERNNRLADAATPK